MARGLGVRRVALPSDAPACCGAFADERRIVAGDEGGRVRIHQIDGPAPVIMPEPEETTRHSTAVSAAAGFPPGKSILLHPPSNRSSVTPKGPFGHMPPLQERVISGLPAPSRLGRISKAHLVIVGLDAVWLAYSLQRFSRRVDLTLTGATWTCARRSVAGATRRARFAPGARLRRGRGDRA